jgi:hypothetical protein
MYEKSFNRYFGAKTHTIEDEIYATRYEIYEFNLPRLALGLINLCVTTLEMI